MKIISNTQYPIPNKNPNAKCQKFGNWELEIRNSAPKRGQGLLEAVIALGIIITGVVAALTLAIANLSSTGASESRIIAAKLAREGVEVVRNIRDSNWVKGAPTLWDAGIDQVGEEHTYAPRWNLDTKQMELPTIADTTTQGRLYYFSGSGMYSPDDRGQGTRFFRRIVLTNICADGGVTCGQSDRVGIRVQSNVSWEQRGALPEQPQVRIIEELYRWR